jgi:hypothetical protein
MTLSAITGIGGYAASVYQTRSASATPAASSADDAASSNAAPTASGNAAGGSASNPLAPGVLSQLLNAQAIDTADLPQINLLTNLTANDRQFVAAATGVVISPDGTLTNPAANGSTASPADTSVSPFILQIAAGRLQGTLTGNITPQSFQQLASQDSRMGQPIDPNAVGAGLQYLENQIAAPQPGSASTA